MAAALAAGWGVAPADVVVLKSGLRYEPAEVLAVTGGVIAYRLGSGRTIQKPLAEVASVTIDGDGDFNRAEGLLKQGKFVEAVAVYSRAERAARGWKKTLVRYRLLAAAEAAGDINRAVKQWVEIVDADDASKAALALRPRKLGPRRGAGNDRAINLLEAKGRIVRTPAYLRAIRELLVDLYERQGRLGEARALAAKLAGGTGQTQPATGQQPPIAPTQANGADLRLARLSLRSGRHREVIERLRPRLRGFSAAELPTGLYLLGSAQLGLAKAEADSAQARALLLAGGLNLMRVAVLFPGSEEAPGALLLAGEVNERLKNPEGARAAYSELISRHGKSPEAGKAKEALKRLAAGAETSPGPS